MGNENFESKKVLKLALTALQSEHTVELFQMLVDSRSIVDKVNGNYVLLPAYDHLYLAAQQLILCEFLISALEAIKASSNLNLIAAEGFEEFVRNTMDEFLNSFNKGNSVTALISTTLESILKYLSFHVSGDTKEYVQDYRARMSALITYMSGYLKLLPVGERGSRAAFIDKVIDDLKGLKGAANTAVSTLSAEISSRVDEVKTKKIQYWKDQKLLTSKQWEKAGFPPEWKQFSPEDIVQFVDEAGISAQAYPEIIISATATNKVEILAPLLACHGDPTRAPEERTPFFGEKDTAGKMARDRLDAPSTDKPINREIEALILAAIRAADKRRILSKEVLVVTLLPKLANTLFDAMQTYRTTLVPTQLAARENDIAKIEKICAAHMELGSKDDAELITKLQDVLNELRFDLWSSFLNAFGVLPQLIQKVNNALLQVGYFITTVYVDVPAPNAPASLSLSESDANTVREKHFAIVKVKNPVKPKDIPITEILPWLKQLPKHDAAPGPGERPGSTCTVS